MALTPSYAAHLLDRDEDLAGSSVERLLVAGEPGGGEPALRAQLEEGWGAKVTEAMGIGDIGVSIWGECEEQDGMHFAARGFVHPELIDPGTGAALNWGDGGEGELVLTHLRQRAAPLLRFRTRDHVHVKTGPCPCGRTAPRIRCIGRTDDMLIVRGVNVFPSALRSVVGQFAPDVSGHIRVRPSSPGVKQQPPLPVSVELARDASPDDSLADAISARLREVLVVQVQVELVPSEASTAANTSHDSWSVNEKTQTQGVHHITLVGADRRTSIDFWEGVLGMPFVFEQPNLDHPADSHLYFDPGDGRLITVFTNEDREADSGRTSTDVGAVHHVAFAVSQATFSQTVERLEERGIDYSGPKDRGFMDSIYFEDPLGLLIELASYRFEPPHGFTHGEVLLEAHKIRVKRGDGNIDQVHLADAIETLVRRSRASLSEEE